MPASSPLEKEILKIDQGLFIEHHRLIDGKIRICGAQEKGWLQIGVLPSGHNVIVGVTDMSKIAAILYNETSWDAREVAPASGLTLNFSPDVTDRILTSKKKVALTEAQKFEGNPKSIIFPAAGEAIELERFMKNLVKRARTADFRNQYAREVDRIKHDLLGLASGVIDDFLARQEELSLHAEYENRHHLAKQIEQDLWHLNPDEDIDNLTLDYFSSSMKISRRTIQLAIQENFKTNFSNLKRAIRLHQIRTMLKKRVSGKTIGEYALAHGFKNWGRLSAYYRGLFGILPRNTDGEEDS